MSHRDLRLLATEARVLQCYALLVIQQDKEQHVLIHADAMFTLLVWHMMGVPPSDPGELRLSPHFHVPCSGLL